MDEACFQVPSAIVHLRHEGTTRWISGRFQIPFKLLRITSELSITGKVAA